MTEPLMILGALGAFLSSCTWALGSATYSHLAQKTPPWTIHMLRAALALPCFVIIALAHTGGPFPLIDTLRAVSRDRLAWLTASMISSYAIGDVLFLWASRHLGIATALALASIYPMWSTLYQVWIQGNPLSPVSFVGLTAIIVGTPLVILSRSKSHALTSRRSAIIGVILGLSTSLFWSLNTISVARGADGLHFSIVNTIRMMIALALCPTVGILISRKVQIFPKIRISPATVAIMVVEAVIGSSAFVFGMTHAPLSIAAALASLAPVIVVPVAMLMRIETFSMKRTGAVAVVVLGVILLLLGR